MINELLKKQIELFKPNTLLDIKNSMKEVLQNIILASLSKNDFFKFAIFYGGTSLRIFRELPRFSEDLDFTLSVNETKFEFEHILLKVLNELKSYGIDAELTMKEKKINTSVLSSYFKFNLSGLLLVTYPEMINNVTNNENISIKVEVETNSIVGGVTETKILTYPSFCIVKTFNMETLFSSKLLAVLNRKWSNRVKGRDFYDYLFYLSLNTKVNLEFLRNGLIQFGYLKDGEVFNLEILKNNLKERFSNIDFEEAKKDVLPFIHANDRFIDSYNKEIFLATIDLIQAC